MSKDIRPGLHFSRQIVRKIAVKRYFGTIDCCEDVSYGAQTLQTGVKFYSA